MAIVKIRRTARQDILLPPPREAARLAFRSIVALMVPVQVLGVLGNDAVRGVAVQRYRGVSQAAFGDVRIYAQASQRYVGMTQAAHGASGVDPVAGVAQQTAQGMTQTAIAGVVIGASAQQRAEGSDQAATGWGLAYGIAVQSYAITMGVVSSVSVVIGQAAQVSAMSSQTAAASMVAGGAASSAAQGMSQTAQGTSGADAVTGTADQLAQRMTQVAAGGISINAVAQQQAGHSGQAAAGAGIVYGFAAHTSARLSQAVTGSTVSIGFADTLSGRGSHNATGAVAPSGSAAQTFGKASQFASASVAPVGNAASTARRMTQSASGVVLWDFANLATPKLEDLNPATFTWSGSNFSSGSNSGSLGGTYTTEFGTPTKAAAALNGYDGITFAGNSGITLPGVTVPAGNLCIIYVVKRLGNPTGGLGPIAAQWKDKPGWTLYDQINISASVGPSGSQNVVPGDVGFAGWPSGTNIYNRDVIAHPPTDDGDYHINISQIGTAHLWNRDGTDLTPTYSVDAANPAITGDLTAGTSGSASNQHANITLVRRVIMLNPTSTEVAKAVGRLHWLYGKQANLPAGHPYKSAPPTV